MLIFSLKAAHDDSSLFTSHLKIFFKLLSLKNLLSNYGYLKKKLKENPQGQSSFIFIRIAINYLESIHRVGKTFLCRKDHYGVARSLITLGSSTRDVSHFHEAAKIMVRDNAVKSALKCFKCPLLISVHQPELQLIPKGHCQFKSINFYWFGCGPYRYSESRQGAGSTLIVDAQKY